MENKLWQIIDPVRPRINRAMVLSGCAAALAVLGLLLLAQILKNLLNGGAVWPWAGGLTVLTR